MQFIFFGLITGSLMAIAAVGFAFIRHTQGFLNIAHGQYMLLGALLGLIMSEAGLNIFLAGTIATLIVGLLGVVIAWIVFYPLRESGLLAQFFSSIGVAFVVYGLIQASWSGNGIRLYRVNFAEPIAIAPLHLSVTLEELVIIGIAWLCIITLHFFLHKTKLGVLIRAESSNAQLAQVRGVRTSSIFSTVWLIGSALAGLSGVLIGILGTVHGELGWQYIVLILAVSVMGGVSNIYGVVAASFIIGFAMELSALVMPSGYAIIALFSVIILTLLAKPEGLFSVQRRYEAGA